MVCSGIGKVMGVVWWKGSALAEGIMSRCESDTATSSAHFATCVKRSTATAPLPYHSGPPTSDSFKASSDGSSDRRWCVECKRLETRPATQQATKPDVRVRSILSCSLGLSLVTRWHLSQQWFNLH